MEVEGPREAVPEYVKYTAGVDLDLVRSSDKRFDRGFNS
jgi:hypothetical protein